jgi:predicted secreted Zn-dependent protease
MTIISNDECQGNILSKELLKILDIKDEQKRRELCSSLAQNASILIDKVIRGLATKQGFDNQDQFEQCVKQHEKLHSKNIREMTAQILERVFISHAEQQRVNEVKKLIYSSMFLKSVIICACEVQFFV